MPHLLDSHEAMLLVIDIQEKFRPVLFNAQAVIENTRRMIAGCNELSVPVLVSEQYPQGLGETVPELKAALLTDTPVLAKTSFGCCGDEAMMDQLRRMNRRQVMVCGIEAHVCVNQTVVSLLQAGFDVHLIEDAIGSRNEANYHLALKKLAQWGAVPSGVEMALFELMRTAKHPSFKAIQQLVK